MGNTLVGYGIGAVLATLFVAYLVSLVATVPFTLLLIGAVTFGIIVFSAALTSGDLVSVTNATRRPSDNSFVFRKQTSAKGRLTAAIYSTSLIVVSFALLVALA
ncbi:MAG: tetrahydromethanopterin S-methyltransferase subunit E [Halobacteriales archaeon]|jgi:tetrahydromethanopterin S-methyltransferase subunit E